MNILYIGGGFVGACSAAVSADSGHHTLVFDVDKDKVAKLSSGDRDTIQSCLHEEGLAELLIRNKNLISFTTDMNQVKEFAHSVDAVFMCLPTPEKVGAEGESDLSYYEQSVKDIGPMLAARNDGAQSKRLVIVNKSTVPIKMIDYTEELFKKQGVENFGIVSNPEFLVEGKAIEDSVHPDRVVVGANNEADLVVMREATWDAFFNCISDRYRNFNDSSMNLYSKEVPGMRVAHFFCKPVIDSLTLPGFSLKQSRRYSLLKRTCVITIGLILSFIEPK